tara:strand:+ start:830 stop:2410 length:1581 start_codon:yes stop_codon:yes gene_type:complete
MATYYNPKIITNNIEFSVDAANIKSWSGPTPVPVGTDYGYFAGGFGAATSKVDRIDYTNDTPTASIKGPLNNTKYGSAGASNTSYGYIAGGNSPKSSVDRIDYSNDTPTATAVGNLSVGHYGASASGNDSYGYVAGGDPSTSIVDRIDYSNDSAVSSPKGPLTATSRYNAAAGNLSYGYVKVGNPAVNSSKIERIDYSNDTATAVEKGPLTSVRYWLAATGNSSYGYYGGDGPYNGSTVIDRVDYSSDTSTALSRGPLATAQAANAATGSSSFGYFAGGHSNTPGSSTRVSNVDRLDYSSDTTTAVGKGPLSSTQSFLAAASSRANGLPTSNPASIMHDITGKGNDVTLVGATFSSDKGGYFVFDGTDDRADTSSDMFDPNADFTFSAWVNADVLTSTNIYTIISDYNNTGSFKLRYKNGSGMQIVDSDVTIVGTFSDSTISTSTWYNVTVTRSSNTYTLYLNGNSISTITSSNAYDHGAQTIGATHSGSSQYWDGKISAITSYSKALTAPEVQNNFNATRTRFGV